MPSYQNLKITKTKADAEIRGELTQEAIKEHEADVIEAARGDFELPGFRKGHVPSETFLKYVDPVHVLEDAAERALQAAYPEILEEAKLDTIGGPHATFTKLAPGNPVEFKIEIALIPEVKLPDYKKVADKVMKNLPPLIVTDEEADKVIDDLRRLRAMKEAPSESTSEEREHEHEDHAGHDHPGHSEPDEESLNAVKDPSAVPPSFAPTTADKQDDKKLPELTDEFVKTLGAFENVADFRAKLKENIRKEKEFEAKQQSREKIAEALIAASKLEVSKMLVDEEAGAAIARLMGELKAANVSLEDYLKRIGKDEKGLAEEYRHAAEQQYKTRFILEAIAAKEGLAPKDEEINDEMGALISRYPDLEPDHAHRYVVNKLRNEKVLQFLENSQ